MLEILVCRDEFVEESKKLVYLLLRKVRVVTGIFHFKRIDVLAPSSHEVRQRTKTWIANRNANSITSMFLQKLDENGLAVKTSFPPSPKCYLVNFPDHVAQLPRAISEV
jgi:hypothetical protein